MGRAALSADGKKRPTAVLMGGASSGPLSPFYDR